MNHSRINRGAKKQTGAYPAEFAAPDMQTEGCMFAEFAQYSGDALEATAFQSMKQKGVSYENAFSELGLKYPRPVAISSG